MATRPHLTRRIPRFGVEPGADPVRLARVLQRAHRLAIQRGSVPDVMRAVIAGSWGRAGAAGVDPDGYAPTILGERETARALTEHPVAANLSEVENLLGPALDTGYFAVLADPDGLLLWAEGDPVALEGAVAPGFLPGHLCSEAAVGTNAVGTAIAVEEPVQIFAAEHFNRRLHSLICAAAPIRDPGTGRIVGVLNLSGDFRSGHPHSLALVAAVARVLEDRLEGRSRVRDETLRADYLEWVATTGCEHSALVTTTGRVLAASPRGWLGPRMRLRRGGSLALPKGVSIDDHQIDADGSALIVRASAADRGEQNPDPRLLEVKLEGRRALVSVGDWRTLLSRRHTEILVQLVLHPEGLDGAELGSLVYGDDWKTVTLRAEISRMRRLLGPLIAGDPYRLLVTVSADRDAIAAALDSLR